MKKMFVVAAVATLAACSPAEEAAEPAQTDVMEEAAAEPLALDGQPAVGNYRVTSPEGEVFTEELRADGTYTATSEKDGEVTTGTWRQESPSVYCNKKDGDGETDGCSDEAMDADGVWQSVDRETGDIYVVERVES